MIKIAVSGCCGKMGSRIITLAREDKAIQLSGAIEVLGHPKLGKDIGEVLGLGAMNVAITSDLDLALKGTDVLVEFTAPLATLAHLGAAKEHKKAMVIGTTGLTAKEAKEIENASKAIPILYSPNMSVGVNVVFEVAGLLAKKLSGFEVEIVEVHHKHKKDAPSGTAKKIAQVIADAKGKSLERLAVYGRQGSDLTRPEDQIGIHAVRAGDIIGEHTVIYCGTGERIELVHRAHSRDTFASGALRAAKFIVDKKPGLYTMQDLLKG